MSKSKYKYRVYNGKIIKQLFENSKIFFLTAFFAIGILMGAFVINKNSNIISNLSGLIDSYTVLKSGQGIIANFCNSLSVNAVFIAISLFLSFSLIGYPFIMCLTVLRGMGMGIVCGYLYSTYKLIGLSYSLLIIYPGAVVSTFAFILACNDGSEYSRNAYAKAIQGKGQFEKDETRIFLIRQLIFLGVCAVSAIIDALVSTAFSRFFEI